MGGDDNTDAVANKNNLDHVELLNVYMYVQGKEVAGRTRTHTVGGSNEFLFD